MFAARSARAHLLALGGVEAAHDRGGPLPAAVAVGRRNPQRFGDDDGRQGKGEVAHQIGRALPPHAAQELGPDGLHARAEAFHHARGEGAADEGPEAGVGGRIAAQHVRGQASQLRVRIGERGRRGGLRGGGDRWAEALAVGRLLAEPSIAPGADDVRVAADPPHALGGHEVDRRLAAEPGVPGVGVGDEIPVAGIQDDGVGIPCAAAHHIVIPIAALAPAPSMGTWRRAVIRRRRAAPPRAFVPLPREVGGPRLP